MGVRRENGQRCAQRARGEPFLIDCHQVARWFAPIASSPGAGTMARPHNATPNYPPSSATGGESCEGQLSSSGITYIESVTTAGRLVCHGSWVGRIYRRISLASTHACPDSPRKLEIDRLRAAANALARVTIDFWTLR
ncbi:hypothetical protein MTO96_011824 [Rhipicephalus appendiculatus]